MTRSLSIGIVIVGAASMLYLGLAQGAGGGPRGGPEDQVLFDFESADALTGWGVRNLAELAVSDEWSTRGKYAAAITFPRWEQGKSHWQWPRVVAQRSSGVLPTGDFSAYDLLQLDFHNPQDYRVLVRVQLNDNSGGFVFRSTYIPAQSTQTYSIQIQEIASAIDVADVSELHLCGARPDRTCRILVDNIRLTTTVPEDIRLQSIPFNAKFGRAGQSFVLATESPMKKVFLEAERFSSTVSNEYQLFAARNEYESFQVIVHPLGKALNNVTWDVSPLRNKAGEEIPATVRLVGYVDCKRAPYEVAYTGWWPDPLLDFMTEVATVPEQEVLPLWVTVHVPEDAAAGEYQGKVTVTATAGGDAEHSEAHSVDIRLRVWDFAVPKHTNLRIALNVSLSEFERIYAGNASAMVRKYENWMLEEYHLNPSYIYAFQPPAWDVERLRELKALGLNGINLGCLFGESRALLAGDVENYWRSYDERMATAAEFLPVAEAAGVRDLCYFYIFDEHPPELLDIVLETATKMKQRWPDIEVITIPQAPHLDGNFGMEHPDGGAIDIWVIHMSQFDGNAEAIMQARRAGRDIWWYNSTDRRPYANWFVESPAIEARLLMGAMTAKYRPGGFLYYAVNLWRTVVGSPNDGPITSGPRTDWNPASESHGGDTYNGVGSIMCPGPNGPLATIRLENIRDGIEDYEYYLLLQDLVRERGEPEQIGQVPSTVVEDTIYYTHDPAVLSAERERVAQEILRLSR